MMRLLAPAKINLHLRVGPPRADGFHPLLSWMCTIGLFDELELEQSTATSLECNDPSLPNGPENLIVRAAMELGVTAKMKLRKRIPPGGGLAGGSSDAARTLVGLNALCNLRHTEAELLKRTARLGSDVSFFLRGPSAICSGVGEIVQPTPAPAARWAVLILPPFPMPTPQVYKRFDQLNLGSAAAIQEQPDWKTWASLRATDLLPKLINDLEPPAFDLNPQLSDLRKQWEARLARPVRMSGSGSTLFTLYDHREDAQAAANFAGATAERVLAVELAPVFTDDLKT
jgi:4-diphosphocytidyl-2-C-methyl-D-erythritol kinase